MARFFLELHHCMVERNNFTFCSMNFYPPPPLSHCKLRVMMRLRICGFLSCRRDSGLDGWWTDCSTSKSSERERQGVWTSVNDAECSSMMSFPCTSSPSHTWLSSSLYACIAFQRHDRQALLISECSPCSATKCHQLYLNPAFTLFSDFSLVCHPAA